jgi:anti-sigma factor RsiW
MSASPSLERLNAFVDGELGLAEQVELERLVAQDAALRARVEHLRALRQAVRANAEYHRAPDALRARLEALVATPAPAAAPPPAAGRRQRLAGTLHRWLGWRPLGAAFAAAAVAVVVMQATLQPSPDERLSEEIVASHVRATLAQRLVDVASSDHHAVKPWLSSKLDYSPPVQDLAGTLQGGRVDYVGGRPVAVLVYRRGNHVVDAYVWPSTAGDAPVAFTSRRGFQIARWRQGGMAYWAVSDLNPQEMQVLVRELGASGTSR